MSNRLNPPDLTPITVTVKDACRLTGLGRSTIYKLISSKRLAIAKVDKRTLVPVDELRKLVSPTGTLGASPLESEAAA